MPSRRTASAKPRQTASGIVGRRVMPAVIDMRAVLGGDETHSEGPVSKRASSCPASVSSRNAVFDPPPSMPRKVTEPSRPELPLDEDHSQAVRVLRDLLRRPYWHRRVSFARWL